MTDTPAPGTFITFEGVEGAGKTTQIARLADWLERQGRKVVVSRDPGGTAIGTKIRGILLDPENANLCDRSELMLYAADRAQHVVEKIQPALAEGAVVLCDRYVHSTLAYQGYGRGLPQADIRWLNDYATRGLMPDLVLLLDLDPVIGLFRATASGEPDRLEREALSFHARVRAGFLVLAAAEPERFVIVPGDEPADRVTAIIQEQVAKRCGIVP
ncbi:MAG: dTMP kinase [Candidatus Sericytochromatia bacterium]|nr:dTMP kinase [Candidatus Sericytochromatia bacterium]